MNERQKLYKQLKEYEKRLGRLRLKWFIGIWLGYSAFFFWLDKPRGVTSIAEFFETLGYAVFLGLIFWFVNAIVWSYLHTSIRPKAAYLEELEKKYNNLD